MQCTEYLSKGVQKPSQRLRWSCWGILQLQDVVLLIFVFICPYLGHSPSVKNGKFSSIFFCFFFSVLLFSGILFSFFYHSHTAHSQEGQSLLQLQCQSVKKINSFCNTTGILSVLTPTIYMKPCYASGPLIILFIFSIYQQPSAKE